MPRQSQPTHRGTLILTRSEVSQLLDLDTCIEAVEGAFHVHGVGAGPAPQVLGTHLKYGGFHTKAGFMELGRPYFAVKTNGNFMENRERFGLPTILGIISLHDGENGRLLAVMDSVEISITRTGAATAVAAKYLSRPNSSTVAIAGCGEQGRVQLRAISRVRPIEAARVWDIDRSRADRLASDLSNELDIDISVTTDFRTAVRGCDICITCTPSREYLVGPNDVPPGCFVAGVGVDNPHKRELSPDLLSGAKLVVDVLEQCVEIGDLRHAIEAGSMTKAQVHAELGAVVSGSAKGRVDDDEIIVFDSTGMALQDVASAAATYQRALASNTGRLIDFLGDIS